MQNYAKKYKNRKRCIKMLPVSRSTHTPNAYNANEQDNPNCKTEFCSY